MLNRIKIEELFSDSKSELKREVDDFDLYLMDDEEGEENNNSPSSTRKRNTARE